MPKLTPLTYEEITLFEDRVYNKYFLSTIKTASKGSSWMTVDKDTLTKDQLLSKDQNGDYTDQRISAMLFGFHMGVRQQECIAQAKGSFAAS